MNAIVNIPSVIDVSKHLDSFDLSEQTFQVCFDDATAKVTYSIESDWEGRDFFIESVELIDEDGKKIDREVTDFEWDVIKLSMQAVEAAIIADEADAAFWNI